MVRRILNITITRPLASTPLSASRIGQTSPISRDTCSTVNSNILGSIRQLLKDNIPSYLVKGHMTQHLRVMWYLNLNYVNYQ